MTCLGSRSAKPNRCSVEIGCWIVNDCNKGAGGGGGGNVTGKSPIRALLVVAAPAVVTAGLAVVTAGIGGLAVVAGPEDEDPLPPSIAPNGNVIVGNGVTHNFLNSKNVASVVKKACNKNIIICPIWNFISVFVKLHSLNYWIINASNFWFYD